MQEASKNSRKRIAAAFIKELEAFKLGGYHFNGSAKALFEGTQREAFDAYLEGITQGHREGYYEIPTGVGKTALFIAIIGCYLRATEHIPNAPRILIHEPTTDLVVQTALSFADFMPDIARGMETDDDQGREIDWGNSQIDIHYARRHGATNKPKVLITTYQGQAADERKQKETRIHKPHDFGLIIHDEAHYLTGAKYGPAAVDKFHGAIQLGVTATPEYSGDKTVANKLGHRYYHLPLNIAIERGDLCHVRPMVLKTHLKGKDAINLQKAREFFAQQRGQSLTNKQLEQLFNQEARNQAIIKAYLTGSHPDTGERFLGQTGLIFAGGITHCNDFILHTERVLSQPAYQKIRQWLRDEGVALIAPIHSQIPKDGVEITIGGARRKCTKEEIKELHRQGKILLIISDQELKLGSDFPMDSFIADAVDRFSVPDATQRMGRGFRVDRGDKRRKLEPNLTKSCAAVNVMDETTHEMYKGTPHYPIHATEILHGAEHRPPGPRKGALTRFKEHPPEVSEGLEALGFEFVTRAEAIRDIAKKFADQKKQPLPEKTDEWLSPRDTTLLPGGHRRPLQSAVKAITGMYDSDKSGEQTITYRRHSFRVQKMQAGQNQPICLYHDEWPMVQKAAGVTPGAVLWDKDDRWLSLRDFKAIPGGQDKAIRAVIDAVIAAYDEEVLGEQTVKYQGQAIRVQKMQAGPKQPICICRDDWPRIKAAVGVLPDKDDRWLAPRDTEAMPGGGRQSVQAAVSAIIDEYETEVLGEQTIKYKGHGIRVQKMRSCASQPICIYRDDWPKVEQAAGVVPGDALPDKDSRWLSLREVKNSPGGNRRGIKPTVDAIVGAYDTETLGIQTITHNGHAFRVQQMQSGPARPICIYGDDVPKLQQAAKCEAHHAEERLKTPLIRKKDITSGSDGLGRTGRSRASRDE